MHHAQQPGSRWRRPLETQHLLQYRFLTVKQKISQVGLQICKHLLSGWRTSYGSLAQLSSSTCRPFCAAKKSSNCHQHVGTWPAGCLVYPNLGMKPAQWISGLSDPNCSPAKNLAIFRHVSWRPVKIFTITEIKGSHKSGKTGIAWSGLIWSFLKRTVKSVMNNPKKNCLVSDVFFVQDIHRTETHSTVPPSPLKPRCAPRCCCFKLIPVHILKIIAFEDRSLEFCKKNNSDRTNASKKKDFKGRSTSW